MSDWVHRNLPWVIGGALALAFGVSAYAVSYSTDKRRSACVDLEALKTITRNEKQQMVRRSLKYLHDHPRGVPGIPRGLIVQNIRDQRKIIEQLAPKNC